MHGGPLLIVFGQARGCGRVNWVFVAPHAPKCEVRKERSLAQPSLKQLRSRTFYEFLACLEQKLR